MTLRDADLKPGDKLEIRRIGLTVKGIKGDNIVMTNNIQYGLDKPDFVPENIVRAPKLPDFWPPKPGDVWSHGGYEYFCFNSGMLTSIYNLISYKPEELIGENEVKLKYRPGITDKDNEVQTQRVIDQAKLISNQSDTIRCLREEISELELDNSQLHDELYEIHDDLSVARSVASDARKEADSYMGWEFKFTYVPGARWSSTDNESAWCSIVETEIDWTDQMKDNNCTIQKVAFRKAKS